MNISEQLVEIQKQAQLSEQAIADAVGVSQSTIHRIKRRKVKKVDFELASSIASLAERHHVNLESHTNQA